MVLLGLIFLAACFGVVGQAVRRWFPQASAAAYLLAVAAVALGSQFYYLLLRPYIYEYAILCGAALLMLGLWLWLSAASTPVEKRGALVVKLVFGSLCVALVAGCRPQMELFAFFGRAHLLAAVYRAEAAAQPRRGRGGRRVSAAGGAGRCRAHVYNAARSARPLTLAPTTT